MDRWTSLNTPGFYWTIVAAQTILATGPGHRVKSVSSNALVSNATLFRTKTFPTMGCCANLNPCDIAYLPIKFFPIILENPVYVFMREELLPHPYKTDCLNYTEKWLKAGRTGPRSQEV
ncbi:hypothetical protein TNCV_4042051 [Trichonephila clavipes]|nr:hypothetical protein TNCV_4042051 [Trichonephila clavipes]